MPRSARTAILATIGALAAASSGAVEIRERDIEDTVRHLASLGSRMPGTQGSREAAEFVERRFRELGLRDVSSQSFPVTVPVDHGGSLLLEGTSSVSQVFGLWPNLVRTPTTGPEGLRGELLYAGTGHLHEFNGVAAERWRGAIVLMDFKSSSRWLNAAMLGACAVGFVEDAEGTRKEAEEKCLRVPFDFPRFLIGRSSLARLLAGSGRRELASADERNLESVLPRLNALARPLRAHLELRMTWEEATCRNVTACLSGSDPALRGETVILQAYFDSVSCAPALAPGAESAGGIAVLLELARALVASPPRRSVTFLATDAHFQGLAGMREYVYALYRDEQARGADKGTLAAAREQEERGTLLVSLDLSSGSSEVGLFFKGHFYDQQAIAGEERFQSKFLPIGDVFDSALAALGNADAAGPGAAEFVNAIRPKRGVEWRAHFPEPVALDSEVYSLDTHPGVALVTTRDSRTRVDTPWDTPDRVSFTRLGSQARLVWGLLSRVLSAESLPANRLGRNLSFVYSDSFCKVVEDTLISYLPTVPVEDGIVACELNGDFSLTGVRGTVFVRTSSDGRFHIAGLPSEQNRRVWAFRFDPGDGRITFVTKTEDPASNPDEVIRGQVKDRSEPWLKRPTDKRLAAYPCVGTAVFDLVDQLHFQHLTNLLVLDARSNSPPRSFTTFVRPWGNPQPEPVGVFFTRREDPETPVKVLLSTWQLSGKRMLLLSAGDSGGPATPEGAGFYPSRMGGSIPYTSLQAAHDMWVLNDARIRQLVRYGIRNARVDELHALSKAAREKALAARAEARYDECIDLARTAWALAAKAYPEVQETTNDVVKGLIFYFALLLPFTYFAERLFFSEYERLPRWILWAVLAGELAYFAPSLLGAYAGPEGLSRREAATAAALAAAIVGALAFALEKTLFRYRDIRQQLGHMALIFAAVYFVLVLVHPAFQISKTPSVILIGFFMLVLALVVMGLLLSRFSQQLRLAREKVSMAHREDVSRGAAAAVAFALGVQNMRKRRMRTLLTSATLVLLMFTILSFTSFQQQTHYSVTAVGRAPSYHGMLVRNVDWRRIERGASFMVTDHFGPLGTTAVRSWIVSEDPKRTLNIPVTDADGRTSYSASAVLGIEDTEAAVTPLARAVKAGRLFTAEEVRRAELVCVLPERMAAHLGVGTEGAEAARTVRMFGRDFRVVGILSEGELAALRDLDGEPLTPVDYAQTAERREEQQRQQVSETGTVLRRGQMLQEYIHLDPGVVVFMPRTTAEHYGAVPRSIAFKPRDGGRAGIERLVRDFANRSILVLFAGLPDPDETYLYSSLAALSVRGLSNLAVPLAIAALMVFNVMIGSVYERTREIFTFASVGLAPVHIGSLFLAESCVYASVGSIFGYLLGQVMAKLVVTFELFSQITVNYSSTSAVVSTAFVAAVVLLSTIFPAKKAADLSVPDETRKLRLPAPVGDVWEFEFPFTVATKEALGLNVFLRDFFESHDENSSGRFMASEVVLEGAGRNEYRLRARTWLMPLDMGISQEVEFRTRPTSYEASISEIWVRIVRLSGEVASWRRMNQGFIVAVRKQFLIWRLVKAESKQAYAERGLAMLGLAAGGAAVASETCPSCGSALKPGARECLRCGYIRGEERAPGQPAAAAGGAAAVGARPVALSTGLGAMAAAAALQVLSWYLSREPLYLVLALAAWGAFIVVSAGLLGRIRSVGRWAARTAWGLAGMNLAAGGFFVFLAMFPGLGTLAPGETPGLYVGRRIVEMGLGLLCAAGFAPAALALGRPSVGAYVEGEPPRAEVGPAGAG